MTMTVKDPLGKYEGVTKQLYEMAFASLYGYTTGSGSALALETGVTVTSTATVPRPSIRR